ncbi:MAG: methyl-accepting chemotaxis protein [Thermodesulfobacteriota bacterium]
MARYVLKSLRAKLTVLFMLIAMIPLVVVGYVCFDRARTSLEQAEFGKLRMLWDTKQNGLLAWFRSVVDDLTFLANTNRLRVALDELIKHGSAAESSGAAMRGLNEVLEGYLELKTVQEGFEDLLLIGGESGKVLYAMRDSGSNGADVRSGALAESAIGRAWRQVVSHRKPVVTDFASYPSAVSACGAVAVPVFHLQTQEFLGALVLRTNSKGIDEILSLHAAGGRTNEVYVVGRDFLMRNQSRFSADSTALATKAATEPIKQALAGKTVEMFAPDYRGEACLSVAAPVGIDKQADFVADFDWAMATDLNEDEAMRGVTSLAWWVAGIAGFVAAAVVITAFFVAHGISKPVVTMADLAAEVSRGNLAATVPDFKREDEIGTLLESFRFMIKNLRDQTTNILEAVEVLGATATEISTSVSQVATSTSQTSTAVTETTATVEQVKQAAMQAVEQAKKVAQDSQVAIEITREGKLNAEDRVQRIHHIKEQMDSISEIVVRLNEHSRSIEEIIGTVQDIADQSNLLAVNASIEAARAGDQGRGFTVVAQEIKTLADQSREATAQVRTILEDNRKWVSAVVMAAEQGGKAVESGVEQAARAAAAIARLSNSVAESAQSAHVIEASIEEQFVGVDQVSSAMRSIEQAMHQVIDGTAQVDTSAKRLAELGARLSGMVGAYRWGSGLVS